MKKCEFCGRECKNALGLSVHQSSCKKYLNQSRPQDSFDINVTDQMHSVVLPAGSHKQPTGKRGPKGRQLSGRSSHIISPDNEIRTSLLYGAQSAYAEKILRVMHSNTGRQRTRNKEVVEDGIKFRRQFDVCVLCNRPALYWTPRGKFCGVHRDAAELAMKKAKEIRYGKNQ